MQKLTLIIFTFLFTTISFGQKMENKNFEASKGKWEVSVPSIIRLSDNYKRHAYYPATCSGMNDSILVITTDSAYVVKTLHAGEVILATEIDSLKFIVLIKFGDYYVSYNPLQNLFVKKGDKISAGKVIGMLAKDFDDNFNLEIGLSFKEKELCAKNWINWKKSKKQHGHQPK
jgi:hypothetical protein